MRVTKDHVKYMIFDGIHTYLHGDHPEACPRTGLVHRYTIVTLVTAAGRISVISIAEHKVWDWAPAAGL